MKTTCAAALASALMIVAAGSAVASDAPPAKPIVVSDKIAVKATVVAIDEATRMVDLKGPQGNIVHVYADEAVTRFPNLKVGDIVNATYYESVAYDIKKPGTPAALDTVTTQTGKYTGAKPGGGVTETTVSTVTITAIDPSVPAVTIRTNDGQIQNFRVRNPQYLKDVKVGDVVVVTKKQALMISAEAAQ